MWKTQVKKIENRKRKINISLFFGLITALLITSSNIFSSNYNDNCFNSVEVKFFNSMFEETESSASENQIKGSPFHNFASEVEIFILDNLSKRFCDELSVGKNYSILLNYFQFGIAMREQDIDRIIRYTAIESGSYASLSVDEQSKEIKVNIIWNPRQMVVDQLILRDEIEKNSDPTLPFSLSEYYRYIEEYVALDRIPSAKEKHGYSTKDSKKFKLPIDFYELASKSLQTTRVPFSSLISATVVELMEASREGYTLAVIASVNKALESDKNVPIHNIKDLENAEIEDVYRFDWSKRTLE